VSDPTSAAPRLPRPGLSAPDQSWLELFYDLVFVASIVVLSGTYAKDTSWSGAIWLILVFSLMWTTWLTTTLLLNRVTVTGTWLRGLMVIQMVLVLGMALTADYTLKDYTDWSGPVFAGVLVVLALMYHRVVKRDPDLHQFFKGRALRCVLAAVIFVLTPLYGDNWYVLPWLVGIALFLWPAGTAVEHDQVDTHHLVHRFGEFTIIMLGEAFVKIGLVSTHEPLDHVDLFGLPLTFVLVFAIWWLYFTDVPVAGLPEPRTRRTAWMGAHFPMHLSITALAVAMSRLLPPVHEAADQTSVRYITMPLTIIVLSLAAIDVVVGTPLALRRARIHMWSAVALVIVWFVLIGESSHDLEGTAVLVTIVLAVSAGRIRRIPTVAEPAAPAD
jgi:low temperature requirement protein LtrA